RSEKGPRTVARPSGQQTPTSMFEISTSIRRVLANSCRIAVSCAPSSDGHRRFNASTLRASSACSYRLIRSRTPSSRAFGLSAGTVEDEGGGLATGGSGGGGAAAAGSAGGALVVAGGAGTIGAGAEDPEGGGAGVAGVGAGGSVRRWCWAKNVSGRA